MTYKAATWLLPELQRRQCKYLKFKYKASKLSVPFDQTQYTFYIDSSDTYIARLPLGLCGISVNSCSIHAKCHMLPTVVILIVFYVMYVCVCVYPCARACVRTCVCVCVCVCDDDVSVELKAHIDVFII